MKIYVVWKRNDGYIDVSGYLPRNYVTGGEYETFKNSGIPVTFEKLGEFTIWEDAYNFAIAQRKAASGENNANN